MGEQWGLSKRNAPLEVGLPEGTCSHRLCRSCEGRSRMGEQWGLSKRNAPLEVGLSESTCSHRLCRSCGGHTRMGELWNLPEPHTPLEVGLSDGAYSHRLCPPIPCAQMKGMRKSFFYPLTASIEKRGMGLCPMFTHGPFRTRLIEW